MAGEMTIKVTEPEIGHNDKPIAADATPAQAQAQAGVDLAAQAHEQAKAQQVPIVEPVVQSVPQEVIQQVEHQVTVEENQKLAEIEKAFEAKLEAQQKAFDEKLEQITGRKGVAQQPTTPYQQPQQQVPEQIDISKMNPFEVNNFDQTQNLEAARKFRSQFSQF